MAAGLRGALGFASWIFLGGAILLMFFVILGGVTQNTPLDKTYFLSVDTSSIPGARAVSQWNYFYVCGADNLDCSDAKAALPFGYAFINGVDNVPAELVGDHADGTTSSYYFYMWRFGWVFYIMALFFAVIALFTGLLSFLRIASGVSSLLCFIATAFQTLAAVLMTVEFVKARNVFRDAGMDAHVGSYAFGFTWAALVCLFLASLLFAGGCFYGRGDKTTTSSRGGLFRRNKSTRDRGSLSRNPEVGSVSRSRWGFPYRFQRKRAAGVLDNDSQRPVVREQYV